MKFTMNFQNIMTPKSALRLMLIVLAIASIATAIFIKLKPPSNPEDFRPWMLAHCTDCPVCKHGIVLCDDAKQVFRDCFIKPSATDDDVDRFFAELDKIPWVFWVTPGVKK